MIDLAPFLSLTGASVTVLSITTCARDNLRGQKSLGPLKMSLEMAHKVIVPQKKIISRSFLNSGTLIVITTRKLCQFFGILLYSDPGFHFSFPGLHLSLSMWWFFCQRSNHRINNAKNCWRFVKINTLLSFFYFFKPKVPLPMPFLLNLFCYFNS